MEVMNRDKTNRIDLFPDGSPIDPWFFDQSVPAAGPGKEYHLKDHGIEDDGTLQTAKLQELIDQVSRGGYNFLWLKFRPDTPQCYEHILAENITGHAENFLNINPWTQFFDIKGRTDMPVSRGDHITLRGCRFDCETFFNVKVDEAQYRLSNLVLEDLEITAANTAYDSAAADGFVARNVRLN